MGLSPSVRFWSEPLRAPRVRNVSDFENRCELGKIETREGGANTYKICASPFLKEFCMARLHFDELILPLSEAQSLELPPNADSRAPRSP